MSKAQDRQRAVNRGELTEKIIKPTQGIGRRLRRDLERQQRKDKRQQTIDALRKARKMSMSSK